MPMTLRDGKVVGSPGQEHGGRNTTGTPYQSPSVATTPSQTVQLAAAAAAAGQVAALG